jgi:hypothetical protein
MSFLRLAGEMSCQEKASPEGRDMEAGTIAVMKLDKLRQKSSLISLVFIIQAIL